MKFRSLTLTVIAIFVSLSLAGITASAEYDPFLDVDENGEIDILDVIELANYFGTSGTSINKTELLLDLLGRIEALENQTVWLPTPAYDSGWVWRAGTHVALKFEHGLKTTNVIVYLTQNSTSQGINDGIDLNSFIPTLRWYNLTENDIFIHDGYGDPHEIRLMMWKISEPPR